MPKLRSLADKYNLDITISLDYVPEEYDYNLLLLDKYSRLLGVGKRDGTGGKSLTIPNWCLKDESYTLKVQTVEGSEVISEESYDLSFRENTLHMEFLRMQNALGMRRAMDFNFSVRKKLWEKHAASLGREAAAQERRNMSFGRKISICEWNRYEEKYLEQMDAVYCDEQKFIGES